MRLIISNASGLPIYEQIKEQVKAAILTGELKEHDALPSLRSLARELQISVLTTTRAYTALEQEGFVKNIQGKGCFVKGCGSERMREQWLVTIKHHLTQAIDAARKADIDGNALHHLLDLLLEVEQDG